MKKLILLSVLLFSFSATLHAQNRSIAFVETKVWDEIVRKAKQENKLIFIDCYTDWCGPCKMLAANVFTQDQVADYFNANFVNAKFEMEKDADGVAHKDVWEIKAFPTLIFVDPNTEAVVHRLVGAGQADWLIEGGQIALDPSKNLNSLTERYKSGDRDPEFIAVYLKALKSAYLKEEQSQVATDFLNSLTADQLATPQNWLLISENIEDPLSKPLREVMANRQKFYDIEGVGQQVVDRKLNNSVLGLAMNVSMWRPGRGEFNQQGCDALTRYLPSIDMPVKDQASAWLTTSSYFRSGDWKAMLAEMRKVESEGILSANQFNHYFQFFIESLASMPDKDGVSEGVKWIDQKIAAITEENTDAYFAKSRLADSKSRLYKAIGNDLAADNTRNESEEYNREGQAASGGRVQQAIRMN